MLLFRIFEMLCVSTNRENADMYLGLIEQKIGRYMMRDFSLGPPNRIGDFEIAFLVDRMRIGDTFIVDDIFIADLQQQQHIKNIIKSESLLLPDRIPVRQQIYQTGLKRYIAEEMGIIYARQQFFSINTVLKSLRLTRFINSMLSKQFVDMYGNVFKAPKTIYDFVAKINHMQIQWGGCIAYSIKYGRNGIFKCSISSSDDSRYSCNSYPELMKQMPPDKQCANVESESTDLEENQRPIYFQHENPSFLDVVSIVFGPYLYYGGQKCDPDYPELVGMEGDSKINYRRPINSLFIFICCAIILLTTQYIICIKIISPFVKQHMAST